MKNLILVTLLALLTACDNAKPIEAGRVIGLSYENPDAGVAIDFPENWSIIHDHETFKLVSQEILSEVEYRRKWENALAKPLVACYKYKDHSAVAPVINPNILITTEFIPKRSGITNETDYIDNFKNALKQHNQDYKFEDIRVIDTKFFKFTSIKMTFEVDNESISKQSLLYKNGDQMLNFTLTWETADTETFSQLWNTFLSSRFVLK